MAILLGLRVVQLAQAANQWGLRHARTVAEVRRKQELVLDPLPI